MYIKYDATPKQRANLLTLSNYMWNLPHGYNKLNMHFYLSKDGCPMDDDPIGAKYALENICGTTACFVGHGPSAGIKSRSLWGWGHYAYKRFGAKEMVMGDSWYFLFSPEWLNDTKQCAMRGWLMLRGEARKDFNYRNRFDAKDFADEIAAA